jgi:putative hydrolase of the HAD superfamily
VQRIDTLILDYGEVLTHPQRSDDMRAMAGVLGIDEAPFREAYWTLRCEYDRGLPAVEYWKRTAASLGLPPVDEAQIAALIACDIMSWTDYRDEMWEVARTFRARGGRTGLLSNGVPEIVARIHADRPLDAVFDAVVVSFQVGLVKPDPAIYRHTLDRLGAQPDTTLFVDDRAENTAAAAALGMHTITFTGSPSVADVKAALGLG